MIACASVKCARARSTTTVDLSQTYLAWAERNLRLNRIAVDSRNRLIRADATQWLRSAEARYGLILCAPPTFSRSKSMRDDFDVQRDHPSLLRACANLLTDDGVLLFSTHFRRFKLALDDERLRAVDITRQTLPPDFARDARFHHTWRITRTKAEARR